MGPEQLADWLKVALYFKLNNQMETWNTYQMRVVLIPIILMVYFIPRFAEFEPRFIYSIILLSLALVAGEVVRSQVQIATAAVYLSHLEANTVTALWESARLTSPYRLLVNVLQPIGLVSSIIVFLSTCLVINKYFKAIIKESALPYTFIQIAAIFLIILNGAIALYIGAFWKSSHIAPPPH